MSWDAATVVLALVAAVLLAGGVALLVLIVRRLTEPAELRALRAAVTAARRGLRTARRARDRAVATAGRAVRDAERRHGAAVRAASARVRRLEDPRGDVVAVLGPLVLHEHRLLTPGGEAELTDIEVLVAVGGDVEVTKRPTLTRAALGAAAFGWAGALGSFALQKRETRDDRHVAVVVDAGDASVLVGLPIDELAAAERFADAVERAVATAPARAAARASELATARDALTRTTADTVALEAAHAELERVTADEALVSAVGAAAATLATAHEALRAALTARRSARRARRGVRRSGPDRTGRAPRVPRRQGPRR